MKAMVPLARHSEVSTPDEHEGHHHGPRGPYAAGRTARHRAQRAPANQPIPHEQQRTNEQRGNNRPAEGDAGKQHRTEQQHRARFQHAIFSLFWLQPHLRFHLMTRSRKHQRYSHEP